jgi:proline racemase
MARHTFTCIDGHSCGTGTSARMAHLHAKARMTGLNTIFDDRDPFAHGFVVA